MASAGADTTPQVPDDTATPDPDVATTYREVRYEYSLNLAPILAYTSHSLLVSTYQAGKLVSRFVTPAAKNSWRGGRALRRAGPQARGGPGEAEERTEGGTAGHLRSETWLSLPSLARSSRSGIMPGKIRHESHQSP